MAVAAGSQTRGTRRIVALIPAHNEEASIQPTTASLHAQTAQPDRIIVIADNCTDRTPALARAAGAEVMVTRGNTHKKAGAINDALKRVLPSLSDQDAVLVQDADTFLDRGFLAATSRKLDEGFGASGGKFRGVPGRGTGRGLLRDEVAQRAAATARSPET